MEDKKCAVCGEVTKQLTNDLFLERNSYYFPTDEAARYLFSMWNYNLEYCSNCHYAAKDISVANESDIELVNSKKYNELFVKLETLPVEDKEDINFADYALHANICENNKDYYNASTSYFKAGDQLFSISYDWKDEQLDHEKNELTEEEQETFNFLIGLSSHYLAKSLETISLRNKSADALIFKAFVQNTLLNFKESKLTLLELTNNYNLTETQKNVVKLLESKMK